MPSDGLSEPLPSDASAGSKTGGSMVEVLSNVPLFAGLGRAELAPLAAMTVARSYRGNVIVVGEGDRADTLYFVLSGRVKVYRATADGREIVLSTQGPGTYFGDMILDDGVRSAAVVTLETCRLASLSRIVFRDSLMEHPDAALALIKSLINRTREMNDRLRDLALVDVKGRVAKLLLSLAREVDGRLVIEEHLTQQEMGEQIGATREMVSRVLKDLRADNYVRFEGKRMVILRKPPRSG
jgi:CRP/FNR family cyclic AMP-dependent transcriptional regulator